MAGRCSVAAAAAAAARGFTGGLLRGKVAWPKSQIEQLCCAKAAWPPPSLPLTERIVPIAEGHGV